MGRFLREDVVNAQEFQDVGLNGSGNHFAVGVGILVEGLALMIAICVLVSDVVDLFELTHAEIEVRVQEHFF